MRSLARVFAFAAAWTWSMSGLAAPHPDAARAQQALASLEVPFEGNVGQYDARVGFAARTFAGTTFVTRDGQIVHTLRGAAGSSGWNLVESLVGGAARPVGTARSATGMTRITSRWQGQVPTYRAVSLGEAWEGIEVSLHAKGTNIEKFFTVAPGADPGRIRVSLAGAKGLDSDPAGALVVATEAGPVRFSAPVAWQWIGGEQRAVTVSYVMAGSEYGFKLGPYDPAAAVTIDPVLQSTFLGGSSSFDQIAGMALDAAGNIYVAGGTSSFTFPGTAGGAQPTPAGFGAYVSKLSPDLTTLIQSTFLGGPDNESIGGLAVDGAGNVFVAGWTNSTSFPGTAGAAQATYGGGAFDGFVTKLAGDLKSIIRTTYLGGSALEEVAGIAIDAGGNIVVVGQTQSTNFPGTAGSAQPNTKGGADAFVARLTNDLGTLVRASYVGGIGQDQASGVAIDASGAIYVAGYTRSADFTTVAGGAQATFGGVQDGFVAKFTSDLATLTQATYLGGDDADFVRAIAIGTGGSIYVTGWTNSTNIPGTAGGALASKPSVVANTSGFITRLPATLQSITQSTYLGGTGSDLAVAIAIDGPGNVYVAGQVLSTNFPGTTGAGGGPVFASKLPASLASVTRSIRMGSSVEDSATRLAFDLAGNLLVAGAAEGGIPGIAGGAQTTVNWFSDAFITRMTTDFLPGPATRFQLTVPANADIGVAFPVTVVALDAAGSVATGYSGTIRWTTSAASSTLPPNGTLTNGTGSFNVTLKSNGNHTITVTDTVTAAITGTSDPVAVTGQLATYFTLSAPASVNANSAFTVTVTARDSVGNVATNYNGAHTVTSNDPSATLPGAGAFVNGVRSFSVTLRTPGSRTVTVTDNSDPTVTGVTGTITVNQVVTLVVTAPTPRNAGQATNITVTARDAANAVVTGYAGTVQITSSDGAATLPANNTLVNGTRTFSVTLRTAGPQTVEADDVNNAAVQGGSAPITVNPGAAVNLLVVAPPTAARNTPFNVSVTARDTFGNTATGYGGTVRITTTDGAATLPPNNTLASGTRNFSVTLQTGGNHTITATDTVTASITGTSGAVAVSSPASTVPTSVDFGGQSMSTRSPARTVTVTNPTGATMNFPTVGVSNAQFEQSNNCATLAAGASCTVTLTFRPNPSLGALGGTVSVTGTLTLTSPSGNVTVPLSGLAERSLVTHYYRSILRRDPDGAGKTFWEAEATRVAALGASVNEVWYAMAQQFYFSAEYAAFNRNDTAFLTDLYNTFFNRPPDAGGLNTWSSNLAQGMPREVVLAEFMFSTEFRNFTQAIFGTSTSRAEVNMVMDFYRGLLGRTPDSTGFNFWVGRFRAAQCQNAAAVTAEVEGISSQFALSTEYIGRNRNNSQYVGDLYNAFLRRGGDLAGVQFWIGQLNSGAQTREQLRVLFKNGTEFQGRVNAVIAQGCL